MSFPQMIAGPIVRFNLIADQIIERKEVIDDKLFGFYRFCIGLAKKVLISNVLGLQAVEIMALPPDQLTFAASWLGILAYTFQIYFDFSGYSDMAIGLGKMMGFTFPENFNNPYNARSITDFWRRWHMTLSQWMRDYLYIPLGGSRVNSKFRLFFNLWIVFLISGLWHGASWSFVIWGSISRLLLSSRSNIFKEISKQNWSDSKCPFYVYCRNDWLGLFQYRRFGSSNILPFKNVLLRRRCINGAFQ